MRPIDERPHVGERTRRSENPIQPILLVGKKGRGTRGGKVDGRRRAEKRSRGGGEGTAGILICLILKGAHGHLPHEVVGLAGGAQRARVLVLVEVPIHHFQSAASALQARWDWHFEGLMMPCLNTPLVLHEAGPRNARVEHVLVSQLDVVEAAMRGYDLHIELFAIVLARDDRQHGDTTTPRVLAALEAAHCRV